MDWKLWEVSEEEGTRTQNSCCLPFCKQGGQWEAVLTVCWGSYQTHNKQRGTWLVQQKRLKGIELSSQTSCIVNHMATSEALFQNPSFSGLFFELWNLSQSLALYEASWSLWTSEMLRTGSVATVQFLPFEGARKGPKRWLGPLESALEWKGRSLRRSSGSGGLFVGGKSNKGHYSTSTRPLWEHKFN